MQESGRTAIVVVVSSENLQFIFEGVTERNVQDVMHKRVGTSNKPILWIVSVARMRRHSTQDFACDLHCPERVAEAHMLGTDVHEVCSAQLSHPTQTLNLRRPQNFPFKLCHHNVAVKTIANHTLIFDSE